MKHAMSTFAITLLLSTCALGLTSCASEEVKGPVPPVTVLKSEPIADPETTQFVPAYSTAPKTLVSSQTAIAPASAFPADQTIQAAPAAAAIIAVPAVYKPFAPVPFNFQQYSVWEGNGLFWFLMFLILLLLLASAQRLRSRRLQENGGGVKEAGLAENEIFVQAPGMSELIKVTVKPESPLQEIIVSVAQVGKFPKEKVHIFLENEAVPLNPNHPLDAKHPLHKTLHIHPQKEIVVTASFNGKEHKMHFSPATSIKKITAWAAYQCEIFDQDATRVYVAIHGYSAPLIATAHLGRYVKHDKNNLELDVMTLARVNA